VERLIQTVDNALENGYPMRVTKSTIIKEWATRTAAESAAHEQECVLEAQAQSERDFGCGVEVPPLPDTQESLEEPTVSSVEREIAERAGELSERRRVVEALRKEGIKRYINDKGEVHVDAAVWFAAMDFVRDLEPCKPLR
jgi:hypothetical protein